MSDEGVSEEYGKAEACAEDDEKEPGKRTQFDNGHEGLRVGGAEEDCGRHGSEGPEHRNEESCFEDEVRVVVAGKEWSEAIVLRVGGHVPPPPWSDSGTDDRRRAQRRVACAER